MNHSVTQYIVVVAVRAHWLRCVCANVHNQRQLVGDYTVFPQVKSGSGQPSDMAIDFVFTSIVFVFYAWLAMTYGTANPAANVQHCNGIGPGACPCVHVQAAPLLVL